LPKQVTLKQYYHLCKEDINAMLEHWTWRQAAGKVAFRFRKVAKAIQKNKHALEEINADADAADADADMDLGEEAEEYLQGDDDNWAWRDGASQGDGGSNGSTEQAFPGQSTGNAAENPSRVGWPLKNCDGRC